MQFFRTRIVDINEHTHRRSLEQVFPCVRLFFCQFELILKNMPRLVSGIVSGLVLTLADKFDFLRVLKT